MIRVAGFVDGFNLYHAIKALEADHLKWLDIRSLCAQFAPPPDLQLTTVFYFSAFAEWRSHSYRRHQAFVAALTATGVTPVMGRFKEKDRACRACGNRWKDHEEKETDVNLALTLYREAARDRFDLALVVSQDSDLGPAIRMVREDFPTKKVRILTPIGLRHSHELTQAAGGTAHAREMKRIHLDRCLLPAEVRDRVGTVVAHRPPEYDPPGR